VGAYEIALEHCQQAHENAKRSQTTVIKKVVNEILGGSTSSAGVSVTPGTAMRTSAVWACVRVLSFGLAALPLHTLVDDNGNKRKATWTREYQMLHRTPNPEQTSFTFRQTEMAQLCLYGNAYSEIEFDDSGYAVALWPIPAWCCEPMRTKDQELFYRVVMPKSGESRDLPAYRVLHVMGLGTDGMKGMSPIRQHAQSIGISLAAEIFGGQFFGQGMNVGGVVEHPMSLSDQGSKNLARSLNEKYAGLGNTHRILLLEEGMKYQKVGIPPNEAQFLETRQFQVEDIARIYGVQLHKIGHLLHATFSNIEHQGIEFVTDTMLPWCVNWEQEYDRKLFDGGRYYTKHNLEGLLRGDTAARAAFYRELFYLSSISPDEIREKEDMNPIPAGLGNRYYVQANMIPADRIDEQIDKNTKNQLTKIMPEMVRKITDREKLNILRAYQKDPGKFGDWVEDYFRDFPEYLLKTINKGVTDAD